MEVKSTYASLVHKFSNGQLQITEDVLAVEEPLEISLEYGPQGQRVTKSISITMRTPGHDAELATGFLFTEGIIENRQQIAKVETLQSWNPEHQGNQILVGLSPNITISLQKLERHFYTSSSCGVCGKSSIEAVHQSGAKKVDASHFQIAAKQLHQLPLKLRGRQQLFAKTGGIHAAGLFDESGKLIKLKEDVGRHNAVDKLIGSILLESGLPLKNHLLFLSGRVSFELVQKALMAGIPIIAAVGAPSSLAIQLASASGITIIGFLRNESFNVYCGEERIKI